MESEAKPRGGEISSITTAQAMDSPKKEAQNGVEWRVPIPEAESATGDHGAAASAPAEAAWARLVTRTPVLLKTKAFGLAENVWKIAADDPRKPVYGIKLGVALTLVSLLYYVRPVYHGVGSNAVWAIMTVVLAFEYTVGGTVSKGLNGTTGTMSAAMLALAVHWVASKSGSRYEPIVASASVFLLAAAAAFSRFIPVVTQRFDYGVTAFILTYGYVAVSGYRDKELPVLALQRVSSYSVGIFLCIAVSALICPVWSGEELRRLTVRNMEQLAAAMDGCFAESAERPQDNTESESEGYRRVVDTKASEDTHAGLAWWEPPHGPFGFRHPYDQYAQVGAAMRRCAYSLEMLDGCAGGGAEVKAPEHAARVLREASARLGAQCARQLKEASSCIATMTTPRGLDVAVAEMNAAMHELQADVMALPSKLTEEENTETSWMEAMALITGVTLLIEVSVRVKGVIDAVHVLATLAKFKTSDDDGLGKKNVRSYPGSKFEPRIGHLVWHTGIIFGSKESIMPGANSTSAALHLALAFVADA